jgi:hypothetical protein
MHDGERIAWDLQAKWVIVGFPKAGTHLAAAMIAPLAKPMESGLSGKAWASAFNDAFTHEDRRLSVVAWQLSELLPGRYYKAHSYHHPDLEAFLWFLGACVLFVYRDPRDVAVSLAYHVLSDNQDVLIHSGREKLLALGDKGEILKAVIAGIDGYPGVMERWEAYAPWLSVPWVFKLKFEDAIARPQAVADLLVRHALDRLGEVFGLRLLQPDTAELVQRMVAAANDREASLTFRAGRVGDWREEFGGEHKALFKETDKNRWLVRLGYEMDDAW